MSFFVPCAILWPGRCHHLAGLIAAVYAAATLLLPIPQYLGVQFRMAEALTVLPFLFPEAIPGLAVGCFLANLASPIMLDWIFGTLATLLAALWSRRMPNVYLAALPPVFCNAVIVGAEIAWFTVQQGGGAFWPAYGLSALTVGLGELAACYLLGVPLAKLLGRTLGAQGRLEAR